MTTIGRPHAELGMYPFESVLWAWDEIWAGIHARAPWTPAVLTRSGDVHARWYDPECVVTQVCGGPFAALHRTDMELVGAFAVDVPHAGAGFYRSVLLSPHDVALTELIGPDRHVVANSADSLSGWLSLLATTVGPGRQWPGPVTFTSSHHDSIRSLAKREADLASIDAWSLALIRSDEPDLVRGLHEIGLGPPIPTPPITARRSLDPHLVEELRVALRDTIADPGTRAARDALRIIAVVDHPIEEYLATLALGPG